MESSYFLQNASYVYTDACLDMRNPCVTEKRHFGTEATVLERHHLHSGGMDLCDGTHVEWESHGDRRPLPDLLEESHPAENLTNKPQRTSDLIRKYVSPLVNVGTARLTLMESMFVIKSHPQKPI
ncbi:uncharacterized protein ACIB01_010568 isoform 3-T3 [Guaruba guarouba]